MLTKAKKKEIVENIEKAAKAQSLVFVNFHGLSVAESAALRKSLKEAGVIFSVVKKTLAKIALDAVNIPGERPELKGELAIAYRTQDFKEGDSIAPARGVYEFQKKLDGKVSILGGIFDGKYASLSEMTKIASIPSLEVLRGMFVNIINSPIQGFAIALGQIAERK